MGLTTVTGLLPVKKTSLRKPQKEEHPDLNFQPCVRPVQYILKPFSGIAKPFRYGCSIFCNHPTDPEAKNFIKKTRKKKGRDENNDQKLAERVGQCLEEMLERYGGSGSKEATPAPAVQESGPNSSPENRKCLTPHPKPSLVLDLRRTHSTETLSTNFGGRVQSAYLSPTGSSLSGSSRPSPPKVQVPLIPHQSHISEDAFEPISKSPDEDEDEEEEDVPRRRGKHRKRKKKHLGRNDEGGKDVMGIIEPGETQVSAYADAFSSNQASPKHISPIPPIIPEKSTLDTSLFDKVTLQHLRRYASVETAESDFRKIPIVFDSVDNTKIILEIHFYMKWRRVLHEALNASNITPDEEMKHIREMIKIPESQPEAWLSLPRTFSMDAARFELPLDRNMLLNMTSIEYLKDYVSVKKNRKLLYSYIFGKYRDKSGKEVRFIDAKVLSKALGEVMGKDLTEEQVNILKGHIDWKEDDKVDLRTWCGICGFTERIFARQFTSQHEEDLGPRPSIELADFEALPRWLIKIKPQPTFFSLLNAILTSDA